MTFAGVGGLINDSNDVRFDGSVQDIILENTLENNSNIELDVKSGRISTIVETYEGKSSSHMNTTLDKDRNSMLQEDAR